MSRIQLLLEARNWEAKKFEARNMPLFIRRMVRQRAAYYRQQYESTFNS